MNDFTNFGGVNGQTALQAADTARGDGYYWVRVGSTWFVALWGQGAQSWSVFGMPILPSAGWDDIGTAKIPPPSPPVQMLG